MKLETQENEDISPERINSLTVQLSENMDKVIRDIEQINLQSKILAVNAKIESARAGDAGSAFSVVASEMGVLSDGIAVLVEGLNQKSSKDFKEIARINEHISTSYRGNRLSDIALTNIDLIDRNLYERSCDVRWWATDNSITEALIQKTPQAYQFASKRMSVILDSYTVYFDLVLSNCEGEIVANGQKNQYSSIGVNVSDTKWFRDAMTCVSGQDYAWETVHHSPLVNNELALVYTTAVHGDRGKENRKIVGALGIIFRYEDLAQTILENAPLSKEEKERSRLCIVDESGLVLADSEHKILEDYIDFKGRDELFAEKKGFIIEEYNGSKCCIAHASAPGYETYTTGWHSLIIQEM
jgi:methyl-accepting chemotaxis protein-like sensor